MNVNIRIPVTVITDGIEEGTYMNIDDDCYDNNLIKLGLNDYGIGIKVNEKELLKSIKLLAIKGESNE